MPSAAADDPGACVICDRIALAARGENPTLIVEMKSGSAVLGDTSSYAATLSSSLVTTYGKGTSSEVRLVTRSRRTS